MKTPTWAVVVGIILMLFGGCGLMKHSQAIVMPEMLDMQQKMMENTVKVIEKSEETYPDWEEEDELDSIYEENETSNQSGFENEEDSLDLYNEVLTFEKTQKEKRLEAAKDLTKNMKEIFSISSFNRKWTVRFGYIGLIVCAIYLLAGAVLVNQKIFAIKFVFFALGLSLLFSIVQMMVLAGDTGNGFIGKIGAYGNIFGITIDVILIIVFSVIDKSDYMKPSVQQQHETKKEDWENF